MWLIILLIVIGVLLLVAELILLPGMTLAGIGALLCYGAAVYFGFADFGTTGGVIVICAIVVLSVIATAISLRNRTWQRFSLKQQIDGTSQPLPGDKISEGDRGVTVTRLAPMGKVAIGRETYEAKSFGDVFLDPGKDVEVVGFENFSVIVKPLN